jgi:hypothetical protein
MQVIEINKSVTINLTTEELRYFKIALSSYISSINLLIKRNCQLGVLSEKEEYYLTPEKTACQDLLNVLRKIEI